MGESPVGLCHPMRIFLALHAGADVVLGVVQDLDRARTRALFDVREGVVDDLLGGTLLAVKHDLVDQLLHQHAPVDGIAGYLLFGWRCSPRHILSPPTTSWSRTWSGPACGC